MISNMKRYANRLTVFIAQRDFDIHLAPFHIPAKDPHFAFFI